MNLLKSFLKKIAYKQVKIDVIGDSLLDEDFDVTVPRISPESSNIKVLLSQDHFPSRQLPGGAANVCAQLKNFNTNVNLFTFLDREAALVFSKKGIENIVYNPLPTGNFIPRKQRYFDGQFQVSDRRDIEKLNYGLCDIKYEQEYLISQCDYTSDVVIFSDYDKGIFSGNVWKIPDNVITIVDPKKAPLSKWKGCTVFKPNFKEAEELSGITDWRDQCEFFISELGCKSVIITMEGNGFVGRTNDYYFKYNPSRMVKPFHTSGAGDCFVAMLALAIAHGFNYYDAAIVAFEISSVYVQQRARSVISPLQLGIKTIEPCLLNNRDFKLVFTNGCFDILHTGHLNTLKYAKSKGDKLVVAVNSDGSVKRLKGEDRPINTISDRVCLLEALEIVDFVCVFEEDDPCEIIKVIKPDVLVKSEDYKGRMPEADLVKEVYYAPLVPGNSTTQILDRL